jgi:Tfp pilus assembly protein PilO
VKISGDSKHRHDDKRTGRPEDDLLVQADGVSDSPSDATESEGQPGSSLGASGEAPDAGVLDNTKDETIAPPADTVDAADAEGATDTEGDEDVADAEDPDEVAAGEGEAEEPESGKKARKTRIPALLRFDSDRLRASWRGNTLGKTAVLVVCVYALVVGAAYSFLKQPLDTRLHMVQEQKNLLHDYVVIQEAGAAISSFKDGLMTGDQRLTVMSEVRLMAEGSGVKIIGDPDLLLARDVPGDFVEYPLRLRIRGTFHEIGEFLSLLEGSPRFTLIEEVEIRSDADSRERDSEATVLLTLAAWEG